MVSVMKSPTLTATTGRVPVMAAPTPMPAYPGSEIGVSMIRCVPNSCTSPVSVLKGWPASATSSPIRNTRGSRRISSAIASFTASPYVSSRSAMTTLLRYAQNQLAEEVAPGHHLVSLGRVGQVEGPSHHAAQAPVVNHVHHRGEAAATAAAAAHQRQWTGLEQAEIERDLIPGRRAGDDEPAAGLEAREALVPHRRADAIEHYVHAAPVRQLLHALAELRRGGVVDHLVGAQLLGLVELPVTSRGDDGTGPDAFGHQEPEAPHATADRLDQHVLPGLELNALDEAMPGGVTGQRKRRRLVELHPVGDALKIDGRDLAILRVTAVQLTTQPLLSLTELVAPSSAGHTGAALDAIFDDDPVAFFPPGDSGSEVRHFAGDVEPENTWQRAGGRAAGADAEIGVIERRPTNANDDLACSRV